MQLANVGWKVVRSSWMYRLSRWVIAAVFAYSGAVKVTDLDGFAQVISDYGVVPEIAVPFTAVLLAVLELVAGAGLAFDVRGSLEVVCALLVTFALALIYGISIGLEIHCGCFGLGSPFEGGGTLLGALVRDVSMLAVCGYLYCWRVHHHNLHGARSVMLSSTLAPDKVKSSPNDEVTT